MGGMSAYDLRDTPTKIANLHLYSPHFNRLPLICFCPLDVRHVCGSSPFTPPPENLVSGRSVCKLQIAIGHWPRPVNSRVSTIWEHLFELDPRVHSVGTGNNLVERILLSPPSAVTVDNWETIYVMGQVSKTIMVSWNGTSSTSTRLGLIHPITFRWHQDTFLSAVISERLTDKT